MIRYCVDQKFCWGLLVPSFCRLFFKASLTAFGLQLISPSGTRVQLLTWRRICWVVLMCTLQQMRQLPSHSPFVHQSKALQPKHCHRYLHQVLALGMRMQVTSWGLICWAAPMRTLQLMQPPPLDSLCAPQSRPRQLTGGPHPGWRPCGRESRLLRAPIRGSCRCRLPLTFAVQVSDTTNCKMHQFQPNRDAHRGLSFEHVHIECAAV